MTIELLYFDGCPNHEPLLARLPGLIADAGIGLRDVDLVRVESDADASRRRFLGSPTLRIGGRDVEPGADERDDFGLKCRLYRVDGRLTGVPADEWIVAALNTKAAGVERLGPVAALIADRSAKARLDGCPAVYRAFHQRVLRSFLAGRVPAADDLERWSAELGVDPGDVVGELERRDLVRRGATGDVASAYPFSGEETVHRVRLAESGLELSAMCAIDALGIPFLAGQPALISSRSAVTGERVEIRVDPHGDTHTEGDELVVVVGRTGDGASATHCCPYTNFVVGRERAEALLAGTPDLEGAVLDLAEATALGREIFGGLLSTEGE